MISSWEPGFKLTDDTTGNQESRGNYRSFPMTNEFIRFPIP
jgi:hypothetical protein